jgi:hypothetical protein
MGNFATYGQVYRKNRTINKSFKIEQGTELNVTNKYGSIQFIAWEKDSVKFEIKIEVRDKKESKVATMMDAINIDFIASKHYVESKTSFAGASSFWSDVKDKTGAVFSSENKTQINFTIYLPSSMPIKIENKYGDIFLGDHQGTASIKLLNGDLKAHAFEGETTIDLGFAYANIKQMTKAQFNLGYHSEVRLSKAEELKIDSRSSRVRIGTVNKIDLKSYRDKYQIENVEIFNADNSYTYLEIQSLGEYISIKAKYGDIDIKNLETGVSKINFDVENTDINLVKPDDRNIEFKLIYNEKAGLFFPEDLNNKITIKKYEKEKLVETTGSLGTSASTPLRVRATLISGNIRVEEN